MDAITVEQLISVEIARVDLKLQSQAGSSPYEVELRQLEASGWLHVLLAGGGGASRTGSTADSGLALVARDWDEVQLVRWHDEIADLIDRMSHSLEEW